MAVLNHLEPQRVFRFFEELCAIPHGSGNTKAVSDWLVDFAKARGLRYVQDQLNNVVIFRDAAPGYESAEPVILQGHMDMVCEKEPGCTKDMAAEGLDLVLEGDTVSAKGTTLGGDDGIAVAMAMAILDDDSLSHPAIEAIFTVDEETGMYGAEGLDVSVLKGRRMLNMDSEDEGIFTVSCAGGARADCCLPVTRSAFSAPVLEISVTGLVGGHSGAEIDKGRANSSMLLGRVLCALEEKTGLRVISVCGGLKDNAIPTGSVALVAADAAAAQAVCAEMDAAFKKEYRVNDPAITVSVRPAETDLLPLDESSSRSVVCMLACLPNGIQAMSADMPGLVQTSLNLGILTTGDDAVHASFSVRSSVATPEADAHPAAGLPDGAAGRLRQHPRRIPRLGVYAPVLPAGPDGPGVHRPVWLRPQGGGHPRRSGVRSVLRQAAGSGLRVLRPRPEGNSHLPGVHVRGLRAAGVRHGGGDPQAYVLTRCVPALSRDLTRDIQGCIGTKFAKIGV